MCDSATAQTLRAATDASLSADLVKRTDLVRQKTSEDFWRWPWLDDAADANTRSIAPNARALLNSESGVTVNRLPEAAIR